MLTNPKGMAYLEIIPLLLLMIFLMKYTMGFFGAIHTGILNTIAARNYAFETFRHRAQLNYFRAAKTPDNLRFQRLTGNRFHGVNDETTIDRSANVGFWATVRPISLPLAESQLSTTDNTQYHNNVIMNENRLQPARRYDGDNIGVEKIWVRQQYGICLNAGCGD